MDFLHTDFLLQLAIDGILAGALYALLACGLNLVFGVMGVINLAHAELMLAGSFLAECDHCRTFSFKGDGR